MLNEKELKKIAWNECTNMLGKELVYAHKHLCCAAYGFFEEDGLFHYTLGMDTKDPPEEIVGKIMGDETPMEFYAFVVVNPNTGEVTRDCESSTLPE